MNRIRLFAVLIIPWLAALVGCVSHIAPYAAKHRDFDVGDYPKSQPPDGASLFARSDAGLAEDDRAHRIGDLVVIQVDETDSATHDATTQLGSSSTMQLGLTGGVFSALQKVMPSVDLGKLLGTDSQHGFDGKGKIQRSGTLSASLPVRVRKVLPNSDLFVEGSKVVMVGNEEHHLYISGVVRQVDLRLDGSVPSSRVADAEIEYTGRGDISDHQRPGWLTRMLHKIWPL